MEGAPKIEQHINKHERGIKWERLKTALKPLYLTGLLTLATLKSVNAQEQPTSTGSIEDKNNPVAERVIPSNIVNGTETIFDMSKVVPGENGFNYYNPDILVDFQTFYTYAKTDAGFMDNVNLDYIRYFHSQERLDRLQSMLEDDVFLTEEEQTDLQDEIDDFVLLENEEEAREQILYEKYIQIKEHVREIEAQKQWLINIIGSNAYLNRLAGELNDMNEAKKMQQQRLDRLKNHQYFISNNSELSAPGVLGHVPVVGDHTYDVFLHNEVNYGENDVITEAGDVKLVSQEKNLTPLHEYEHQNNVDLMTDFADLQLWSNFLPHNLYEHEDVGYYGDVDELMARKRVLDYELDNLGIKKYEEEFDETHYRQIKELQEKGQLSRDAELFFRVYTKDALILIMNTVAENIDQAPKNKDHTVHWNDAVKMNNEEIA